MVQDRRQISDIEMMIGQVCIRNILLENKIGQCCDSFWAFVNKKLCL